jgi:hypothetical protein
MLLYKSFDAGYSTSMATVGLPEAFHRCQVNLIPFETGGEVMGLLDKLWHAVSSATVSTGAGVIRVAALKKAQLELGEIENRYNDGYLIIGKRIAEVLRNGEDISDPKVQEAFQRIKKLDGEKAEKEAVIRELKGDAADSTEPEDLVALEKEVDNEIAKCKEVLAMGVDSQEECDRKVAVLRNMLDHFKQLRNLNQARAKKLISEDEYKKKKAALLG